MTAITLAKSGQRYSHEAWVSMPADEQSQLLNKFGPGYTDEAWLKNQQIQQKSFNRVRSFRK